MWWFSSFTVSFVIFMQILFPRIKILPRYTTWTNSDLCIIPHTRNTAITKCLTRINKQINKHRLSVWRLERSGQDQAADAWVITASENMRCSPAKLPRLRSQWTQHPRGAGKETQKLSHKHSLTGVSNWADNIRPFKAGGLPGSDGRTLKAF